MLQLRPCQISFRNEISPSWVHHSQVRVNTIILSAGQLLKSSRKPWFTFSHQRLSADVWICYRNSSNHFMNCFKQMMIKQDYFYFLLYRSGLYISNSLWKFGEIFSCNHHHIWIKMSTLIAAPLVVNCMKHWRVVNFIMLLAVTL